MHLPTSSRGSDWNLNAAKKDKGVAVASLSSRKRHIKRMGIEVSELGFGGWGIGGRFWALQHRSRALRL